MSVRVNRKEELDDALAVVPDHDSPSLVEITCDVELV